MNSIELLSPVGDFECLQAAVQNGADAVYLGASSFSARASAKNFNLKELEKAVSYAHLRGVKVHLALNTLIKNNEFEEAFELAKHCYNLGVDAFIVQDYGLCSLLLEHFPDLPIHASTQMSIHNLEGVKKLEDLGFSRVVLARETSLAELEFIKNHTNIELEVFIHGALCISYSGQCLLSSMIGRSFAEIVENVLELVVFLMNWLLNLIKKFVWIRGIY
ncbi:MAG: U32 family peptidase [Clostridia bacterium]|nr:U32 family peptidase [Clostridia bacterium]